MSGHVGSRFVVGGVDRVLPAFWRGVTVEGVNDHGEHRVGGGPGVVGDPVAVGGHCQRHQPCAWISQPGADDGAVLGPGPLDVSPINSEAVATRSTTAHLRGSPQRDSRVAVREDSAAPGEHAGAADTLTFAAYLAVTAALPAAAACGGHDPARRTNGQLRDLEPWRLTALRMHPVLRATGSAMPLDDIVLAHVRHRQRGWNHDDPLHYAYRALNRPFSSAIRRQGGAAGGFSPAGARRPGSGAVASARGTRRTAEQETRRRGPRRTRSGDLPPRLRGLRSAGLNGRGPC